MMVKDALRVILYSMCSGTNVGKIEIMCFYLEQIAAKLTANYATCNNIAPLYEEDLERKQFCIKAGFMNNFENFLNMDGASCDL